MTRPDPRRTVFRTVFFAAFLALWLPIPGTGREMAHAAVRTATPIRHVIIVIGENRTFDNLFATYRPAIGQTVRNLLSEGIVTAMGNPGPRFGIARQFAARERRVYRLAPPVLAPYRALPTPNTTYAPGVPWAVSRPALFPDPGLEPDAQRLLKTGGTGLLKDAPDTRFPGRLPNGPYPITRYVPYDSYTGDPVHRFFQMWQQSHCAKTHITSANPSGCTHDLSTWVAVRTGLGANGKKPPKPFTVQSTKQGGVQMGFYSMAAGDAPYFKWIADHFAMSDNYHQPIMGGTGANHVMLGTGDAVWYSDGRGRPARPPANQIENPDPMPGTDNWYTQDGYKGGSYVNCADRSQPGVRAIRSYLGTLPSRPASRCESGHYYLVNNYNPGYHRDGSLYTSGYYVPASTLRTIGDAMTERGLSWAYYGEGFRPGTPQSSKYCNICNPFQYATSVMTTPLRKNIGGLRDFYGAIRSRSLPDVSFLKPDSLLDGHPASSKPGLFEGFVKKVVDTVHNSPYWKDTAIFITFDEGGGYYDSGYIQPIDFFGDGPRIPFLVVSRFSEGGRVVHTYYDHVSVLKFIERNWGLPPLTARSRDNLPDPVARRGNPYVPANGPAIGDLMEMFRFPDDH